MSQVINNTLAADAIVALTAEAGPLDGLKAVPFVEDFTPSNSSTMSNIVWSDDSGLAEQDVVWAEAQQHADGSYGVLGGLLRFQMVEGAEPQTIYGVALFRLEGSAQVLVAVDHFDEPQYLGNLDQTVDYVPRFSINPALTVYGQGVVVD